MNINSVISGKFVRVPLKVSYEDWFSVSFLLWYEVDELASVMVVIGWLRSFGCNCFLGWLS